MELVNNGFTYHCEVHDRRPKGKERGRVLNLAFAGFKETARQRGAGAETAITLDEL
jgi:hypothetical protein